MDFFLFIINMLWMYESTIYVRMNWMWRLSLRIATIHVLNLFVCIHKDEWEKNISSMAVLKWNGRHEAVRRHFFYFLLDNEFQSIEKYFHSICSSFSLNYGATFVYFLPQTLENFLFVCICNKITENLLSIEAAPLSLYLFFISSFILIFFFNIHFNWNEIKFILPSLLSFVFRSTSQTSNFLIEINQMWDVFIC